MPNPPTDDDLLTTGQAAEILGTTARHVVNLCLRGELPYTLAGTHRRVRRADVTAFAARAAANRGGPLTDDQLRSLWLHRAAAGHVAAEPARSLEISKRLAPSTRARSPWSSSRSTCLATGGTASSTTRTHTASGTSSVLVAGDRFELPTFGL